MKRLLPCLLICAMCLTLFPAAVLAEDTTVKATVQSEGSLVIDDGADLLTDEEEAELISRYSVITEYLPAAFVTTSKSASTTDVYAEAYAILHYGNDPAVLFLIDMDDRMIYLYSNGDALKIVSVDDAQDIVDAIYIDASRGDYFACADGAFSRILDRIPNDSTENEIFTSGEYKYVLLDDGIAEIIRYSGEDEELTIPDILAGHNVASIGKDAFFFCGNLNSVIIPDCINEIEENPFTICYNLTSIVVSPVHPVLAVIDGVLFYKADKRLICYPAGKQDAQYEIPQGIEIISSRAFSYCTNLTSITIPDSVTEIGENAFSDCPNLTLTVPHDSYVEQYCKENGLTYTYIDALYWLNE